MTPERVMQLAEACTPYTCGSSNDAEVIARAITQAVNEALEECRAICQQEGDEWDSDALQTYKNYAHACRDNINALKLPENI